MLGACWSLRTASAAERFASSVPDLQPVLNDGSIKMADDNNHDDDLRPEYCREDFPGGLKRGRYAKRMAEGSNIVRIDPDLLAAFPDSVAVNEALRALLRIAERSAGKR